MSSTEASRSSTAVIAIAWAIASAFLFALSNVAIRMVQHAGAIDTALIRCLVYAMVLGPLVATGRMPTAPFRSLHVGVALAWFTAATLLTNVTWFLGLQALPLATATSLFSLKAAFAVFGAAALLGERLSSRRLIGLAIGFIGGAVLLEPARPSLLGAAWVLCAAVSSALGGIFYAQLVRVQSPARVLLVSAVLQLLALAPVALVESAGLPPHTLLIAGLSGVLSIGVMYSLAWAYRGADVGLVALLEYLRLPFAAALAYLFFAERPTLAFYAGSGIIIGSMLLAKPSMAARTISVAK